MLNVLKVAGLMLTLKVYAIYSNIPRKRDNFTERKKKHQIFYQVWTGAYKKHLWATDQSSTEQKKDLKLTAWLGFMSLSCNSAASWNFPWTQRSFKSQHSCPITFAKAQMPPTAPKRI